jgi:N-dimethylarginine dimethylaminohydrolase
VIEAHVPELLPVSTAEAMRFACNAVADGKRVLLNAGCPRLAAALEKKGFDVLEADLSEFIKAGGAAKCLVLFLS